MSSLRFGDALIDWLASRESFVGSVHFTGSFQQIQAGEFVPERRGGFVYEGDLGGDIAGDSRHAEGLAPFGCPTEFTDVWYLGIKMPRKNVYPELLGRFKKIAEQLFSLGLQFSRNHQSKF